MKRYLTKATLMAVLAGWTVGGPAVSSHGQTSSTGAASNAVGGSGLPIGQSSGTAFNGAQTNAIGQSRGTQLGLQGTQNIQLRNQQLRAQRLAAQQQQLRARQLAAQQQARSGGSNNLQNNGQMFDEDFPNSRNQDPIEARSGRVNRSNANQSLNQDPVAARSGRTDRNNIDRTMNQDPLQARSGRTNNSPLLQSRNQDPLQARSGRFDDDFDRSANESPAAARARMIDRYQAAASDAQLGPRNRSRNFDNQSDDGQNSSFSQTNRDFQGDTFDSRIDDPRLDNRQFVDPRTGQRAMADSQFNDRRIDSRINQARSSSLPDATGQVWALDYFDDDADWLDGYSGVGSGAPVTYGGGWQQPNNRNQPQDSSRMNADNAGAPPVRGASVAGGGGARPSAIRQSAPMDRLPDNAATRRGSMYTENDARRIDDGRYTGVGRGLDIAPPPPARQFARDTWNTGYRGADRATQRSDVRDPLETRTGRFNRGTNTTIDRSSGGVERRTTRFDQQMNDRFDGIYDRGYDNRFDQVDERRRGIDSENAYE